MSILSSIRVRIAALLELPAAFDAAVKLARVTTERDAARRTRKMAVKAWALACDRAKVAETQHDAVVAERERDIAAAVTLAGQFDAITIERLRSEIAVLKSLSPTAAARMAGRRAATSDSVVLNNPFNFANDPELAQAWAIGYEEESKC